MASATSPTVPLPTQTDIDDDDNDDDDLSPTTPSQVSATSVPGQPQPSSTTVASTVASPAAPSAAQSIAPSATGTSSAVAVPSSSVTSLGESLPSGGVQETVVPGNNPASDGNGLSSGGTAGIAVGVVIAVLLMVIGGWFFIRRRRSRVRQTHIALGNSTARDHICDEETAIKSEVYAYRAPDAAELGGDQDIGNGDRRPLELESPTAPAEVTGDRHFAVELQGSEVPMRGEKM